MYELYPVQETETEADELISVCVIINEDTKSKTH